MTRGPPAWPAVPCRAALQKGTGWSFPMVDARPTSSCLAVVALLLAGCVASTSSPSDASESVGGTLEGVVVDAAIRPLAGVTLRLEPGGLNQTSNANGRFAFVDVQPSDYILSASKAGYLPKKTPVHIGTTGSEPLVRLVLDLKLGDLKYANLYKFHGFYECGVWPTNGCANINIATGIVLCSYNVPCFNVTGDRSVFLQWVAPGLTFVQPEMYWTPTLDTGKSLLFGIGGANEAELQAGRAPLYNATEGESPLLLTLSGETLNQSKIGYERALLVQISSGVAYPIPGGCAPLVDSCGLGVHVEQDFEVITSAFYGYKPPAGWSFASTGKTPPPP